MAVSHAAQVIHWQSNLAQEDMPPSWMWHLTDELEDWFEEVEYRRKERLGIEDDDDDDDAFGPGIQNEYAKNLRGR